MIPDIGLIALVIAFGLSVYATLISVNGGMSQQQRWVASARNATVAVFALLTISVLSVVYSLYVTGFLSGLCGGCFQPGHVTVLAHHRFVGRTGRIGVVLGLDDGWFCGGGGRCANGTQIRELMPYVIFVAMLTTTFFVGVVLFITNPFTKMWLVPGAQDLVNGDFPTGQRPAVYPDEGSGLNPLLRHFGMIGHPPTTYLGFTGFVIPFAFAIAAC